MGQTCEIGNYIIMEGGIDCDEDAIKPIMIASLRTGLAKSKEAARIWAERFWQIEKKKLRTDWLKGGIKDLLEARKKHEVEKIAKSLLIPKSEFSSFAFSARDCGFEYSRYFREYLPKGTDLKDLPKLIHLERSGNVVSVGETPLTDGQLKHIITYRKNICAHIFEKEGQSHCFYFTYNDVKGSHWEKGSHVHYVSHLWGFYKEHILEELKKKDFNLRGVHIKFDDEA